MASSPLIAYRYQLHEQLGAGGMGTVYRAYDRLNDQIVALKRVMVTPPGVPRQPGGTSDGDFRIALAREFKLLATLRHPNIISVLDYGFDSGGNPFITMELLQNARHLPEAAQDQPREIQINLLIQLLQALTYLHRRGIVHRDLKPPNVLVTSDGVVKLLDFGVAQPVNPGSGSEMEFRNVAGTLAYMAPEVLLEEPATASSDLYAFGTLAYEMLVGKHPFGGSMGALVMNMLTQKPDVSMIEGEMGAVIEKLLAKKPHDRYPDAPSVIDAIYRAVGMPPQEEPASLRESFIHAAQFVGRKAELDTLIDALKQILSSHSPSGSLWLIGGESGVGKSRLLEELRTYAMVKGVLVLRGQAVAQGGLPFQTVREPLRRVLLSTPVDDLEAAVLREMFPELNMPLPNPVVAAPPLEGKAGKERFVAIILNILKRASLQQPILILLEDLHWVDDHFPILKALDGVIADMPVMIIGTYRPEERPALPQEVPGALTMMLGRLNTQEIATLSEAMLGDAGRAPQVLDLLRRETEGNAFFLVEVVRALAEDTGRMEDIGSMTLPAHVLTGGVRAVIAQRLSRVSTEGQKLLQLAAVAGRELDLSLMQKFISDRENIPPLPLDKTLIGEFVSFAPFPPSLEGWLTDCLNAGVLEVFEGRWRFTHDKLREAAIAAMPPNLLRRLHAQTAEALEGLYPDSPEHASALAHHWHMAQNTEKEFYYEREAGAFAERMGSYTESVVHFQQALFLSPANDLESRAQLLLKLGAAYYQLADYTRATEYLSETLKLSRNLDIVETRADALLLLSTVLWRLGRNAEARRYAEECLELCRAIDYPRGEILVLIRLGMISFAVELLQEALVLAREFGDPGVLLVVLNNNGVRARVLGQYEQAKAYHREQAALARKVGSQGELAYALNNLANIGLQQGDMENARTLIEEAIDLHRTLGQRAPLVDALQHLGTIFITEARYHEARTCFQSAEALAESIDYHVGVLESKAYLGDLAYAQGDYTDAEAYYSVYLTKSLERDDENHAAAAAVALGHVSRQRGEMERAQKLYRQAIKLMPRRVEPFLAHVLIGYAGTMDDTELALRWLGLAMNVSTLDVAPRREGEGILQRLGARVSDQKIEMLLYEGRTLSLNAVIDEIVGLGTAV
jgi:eukaryotic-like serine/threonine-protein kinase